MNDKNTVKVAAAYILNEKGDRFMICRRPEGKKRGLLWEFVGGKLEAGETAAEALVRECREELDIEIEPHETFMTVLHEYPDITVELTVISSSIKSGKPRLNEHAGLVWITPDEIDKFEFCPADRLILEKIKNNSVKTQE